MPIIEIDRHTDKDKVTGEATPEGILKAKDLKANKLRAITFGDGVVFCYHTSKSRTKTTLDAILETQLEMGNTQFKYSGIAEKLEEGGVEDYESQLVNYITEKLDVKGQVVEKFVDNVWFECLMESDEDFFDNFEIEIKPGKQIARDAFVWLMEHLEGQDNALAISHGIVIGAMTYTLERKLKLPLRLLPGNSTTFFAPDGPLQPLSGIIFSREDECPDMVGMSFYGLQTTFPIKICENLTK
jgi:hypothetical protein